jgi:hypothetical protein
MTQMRWLKVSGLAAGPAILLALNVPALGQNMTINAFVDLNGKKIPTICLISKAPPKDLCGPILQGISVAQFQSLREAVEQQLEQQSRTLLQQQNR